MKVCDETHYANSELESPTELLDLQNQVRFLLGVHFCWVTISSIWLKFLVPGILTRSK